MARTKILSPIERKCPVCSAPFSVDSPRSLARYCSNACKQQAYLSRKDQPQLNGKATKKNNSVAPALGSILLEKEPAFPPKIQALFLMDYLNLHGQEITTQKLRNQLKRLEKHLEAAEEWSDLLREVYEHLQFVWAKVDGNFRFTFKCNNIRKIQRYIKEAAEE